MLSAHDLGGLALHRNGTIAAVFLHGTRMAGRQPFQQWILQASYNEYNDKFLYYRMK